MHVVMLLSKAFRHDGRVRKEARTLMDAGHDVTVVQWDRHEPEAPAHEPIDGATVLRVRSRPRSALVGNPLWWRRAARAVRQLAKTKAVHVVHAHDLDTLPAAVAIKRRLGIPIVYDAHEIFAYLVEAHQGKIVAAAAQRLEDWGLKHVDAIITVNSALQDFFQARCRAPITLVENVPPLQSRPAAPPEGPFRVLYAGTMDESRFFPTALEALGGMNGVEFLLAGKTGKMEAHVQKAVADGGNIHYLGLVSPQEVLDLTTRSHAVLCLLNPDARINRIGSPNKLFEAMMAGRPSIVAEGTWSGSFVAQHEVGKAIEYDARALRQAVRDLASDPAAAAKLGANGRALAETTFNWESMERRLLHVYDALDVPGRAAANPAPV